MSPAHRLYAVILARDGRQCVYCGAMEEDVDGLSVDHVVPRIMFRLGTAEGDMDDPANLVTACAGCNGLKRDMPVDVFALYLLTVHGWTAPRALAMMERVRAATARKVSK